MRSFWRCIWWAFGVTVLLCHSVASQIPEKPLTYPEVITSLQTKTPNASFKTRAALLKFVIERIRSRKIDKPLTKDREEDLRQAGATEEFIAAVRSNSPTGDSDTGLNPAVVELGDISVRATSLVKPEYTSEAKKAGVTGAISVQFLVDETGQVVSAKALNELGGGLTEQVLTAARQTKFNPVSVGGRPAKFSGTIKYNFTNPGPTTSPLLTEAEGYRKKGDCDRAIASYSTVIRSFGNSSKAYFGRGLCQIEKLSFEKAISDLEAATKLDQQDAEAFFYLGVANDYAGTRAVQKNYEAAVKLKPELLTRSLTNCLYIDGRNVAKDKIDEFAGTIIDACNTVLRGPADSLTTLAYVKRGIGFRLKRDYDKAISDLETALKRNPQVTAVKFQLHLAYSGRGLLHYNNQELKEAFADISKAIEIDPQSPTPYVNRCVIYLYGWKDIDHAIADCSTAIELSGKSSMAYNHRGYAYEMKKNYVSAIADYQKALQIDPKNQTAQAHLDRLQDPSIKKDRPKQ